MDKDVKKALDKVEDAIKGGRRKRRRGVPARRATKIKRGTRGTATQGVSYQFGGQRTAADGSLEFRVVPVKNGVPQLGGAFWSKAWNWVKRGAKVLNKVAKGTGVLGELAKHVPVVGSTASRILKQQGYGQRGGQGRIVKKGNALAAAR